MFSVGLTGTIASGKSTVSQLFEEQGAAIISADLAARELTQVNQPALNAIVEHFGQSILKPSGELDRQALREIVFSNAPERLWLEQLLHPLIRQYLENQIKHCSAPYVLVEIPLLKNRADYPYLDRVLLVSTNHEEAVERVIKRDRCSRAQAETILAVQKNGTEKNRLIDDFIENNSTITELAKKIKNLHQIYLQLARQKS